MADEKAFEDLFDSQTQYVLNKCFNDGRFKSVKKVEVFRRKVKKKKWIFTYSKRVRVIRFIVDESQYIMECLMDELNLQDTVASTTDEILEIVDEQGNLVV